MTRHNRAGIDDRWHRKEKTPNGTVIVPSNMYGKVTRWRVRWVKNGKEHSKVFDRKPDAQKHLKTVLAELDHPGESEESFETIAEQWFKTKGHRKPSTLAGYRSVLNTLAIPKWGDTPIKDITYEDYIGWLSGLGVDGSQKNKPLSASRIIKAHQLMGAVMKYAQKTGKLNRNIALELSRAQDLPRAVQKERRYLTHNELIRLSNNVEGFEILTLVLGYCGIRFGEAAALKRMNVGATELSIWASATRVPGSGIVETSTKTHRSRHVPVPPPVMRALQTILPPRPDDYVFPGRNGILSLEEYRRAFDKGCEKADIEGLVPHGLRHTAASLAISAGANVKVVQRMLGHATAAMTLDLYGHLFDDDLTAVAVALGKAIDSTAESLRYPAKMEQQAS